MALPCVRFRVGWKLPLPCVNVDISDVRKRWTQPSGKKAGENRHLLFKFVIGANVSKWV